MPDKRSDKVEGFKLTKSQKEFQKAHKLSRRILEMIQAKGMNEMRKLQDTNALMRAWKISYDGLMEQAPQSGVTEIPGMRFPDERQAQQQQQITPEQATIRY